MRPRRAGPRRAHLEQGAPVGVSRTTTARDRLERPLGLRTSSCRISPSTSDATASQRDAVGLGTAGDSDQSPPATARCTEPSLPPRPHFLGDKRQIGREQPQQRSTARPAAPDWPTLRRRRLDRRSAATSPARDSCRRSSRRTPRPFEHARVVVVLERRRRLLDQPTELGQHPAIERCGHRPRRLGRASANFDAFSSLIASRRPTFIWPTIERRVDTRSAARRPVAHAVGPVLLEQAHRRDDVALRLRHLLPIGIEHKAGDRRMRPRQRVVLEMRPQHRREEPRPDDVVRLRRRSIGKTRANRSGSLSQPPAICGVTDEVAHVSMTSGSPTKPPG